MVACEVRQSKGASSNQELRHETIRKREPAKGELFRRRNEIDDEGEEVISAIIQSRKRLSERAFSVSWNMLVGRVYSMAHSHGPSTFSRSSQARAGRWSSPPSTSDGIFVSLVNDRALPYSAPTEDL